MAHYFIENVMSESSDQDIFGNSPSRITRPLDMNENDQTGFSEYGFHDPSLSDMDENYVPRSRAERTGLSDREMEKIVEEHIQTGLELMRNGGYQEAVTHFANAEVAQKVGFMLYSEYEYPLRVQSTPQTIPDIAWELINLSYFSWGDIGQIKLLKVSPDTSQNITISPALYHEMALAYAVPWLYAKERLLTTSIFVPDLNVLQYFYSQKVPMTRTFVSLNSHIEMHKKRPGDIIGGERRGDIPGGEPRKD